MTTKKIYGPWIKWHGGECPVPSEMFVEIRYRSGDIEKAFAGDRWWNHDRGIADIVEYRTFTEEPDLEAAEQLLRANDYTVIPPAKPITFEDVVPMTEVPPAGTKYWVISLSDQWGVMPWRSEGGMVEKNFIKRRVAYLDKEHARIAARHIFGLKGGEL